MIWLKKYWVLGLALGVTASAWLAAPRWTVKLPGARAEANLRHRVHLDHAAFFTAPLKSGEAVTAACLKCHPGAASEVMRTSHWTWLGDQVTRPGWTAPQPVGKANLINNFCLNVQGNWPACTKCHAGYGWSDAKFDFKDAAKVDCLVCHDRSGQYVKAASGLPSADSDLLASAKSVGFPQRGNCGTCHYYGGGGLGVKHGDLDNSLDNPAEDLDVHMGRYKLLCIDCHKTRRHAIPGKSFSVSLRDTGGIGCQDCHGGFRHADATVERHRGALACQTCHVPSFARAVPTKMTWDWSKAGDSSRQDDPHHYLKIKGEFTYQQDVKPEYHWFKSEVGRYLAGDPIAARGVTELNPLKGDLHDPAARIWPFKVHRGRQPFDTVNRTLLQPVTGGEGGYWTTFNWDKSFRTAEKLGGLKYSGHYGFTDTVMYWPLTHMVAPKEKALACLDCHGSGGPMDFKALGYGGDPMLTGGRR